MIYRAGGAGAGRPLPCASSPRFTHHVSCVSRVSRLSRFSRPSRLSIRIRMHAHRARQAWLLLVLLSLFTLPLLKFTFHALVGLSAFVVADQ